MLKANRFSAVHRVVSETIWLVALDGTSNWHGQRTGHSWLQERYRPSRERPCACGVEKACRLTRSARPGPVACARLSALGGPRPH
jgi:hypothetical protein